MKTLESCIYVGEVGHKRVKPVQHSLHYRVYDLFVDVDELEALSKRLKFFSYNKFNLFSLHDAKFGAGDGATISDHVWGLVRNSVFHGRVQRIFMLCYPAVLGRMFNPLTTYYCYGKNETLCMMIYEVSNTFGERHSYVIPIEGSMKQSYPKRLYVSPFNAVAGTYDFSVQPPGQKLNLSVGLRVDGKAVMQAWFNGQRRDLDDGALLRSFFSLPLQPLKVMAGIHWEAFKLWVKGAKVVMHPIQQEPRVSFSKHANTELESKS
jgi:uncharacterized protein